MDNPREARAFRFVRRDYADGVASLVYAFDDGPELVERIAFPDAPVLAPDRRPASDAALDLLHLVAGISYYKAGVPEAMHVESTVLDATTAAFLDTLYLHGLGEFAYHNKLDLRGRIRFPIGTTTSAHHAPTQVASTAGPSLPARTLVPIGGGKDSLVSVEMLKRSGEDATATWVGDSQLIAACAQRTGLPTLNIRRELAPLLFEYNKRGAYNGHIPVTAINSAILSVAAVLYGYDAIAFSNERSASSATLEYDGQPNGMKFLTDGRLLVADHHKGMVICDPATGKVEPWYERYLLEPFLGCNDLTIARNGDIWFTDQGQSGWHNPNGRLFRVRAGSKRLELMLDGIPSPNGLVLNKAETALYLAVTRANAVWRLPLVNASGDPGGEVISKVGTYIQMSGGSGPDGLTIDENDNLVVCHVGFGAVWLFSDRGEPMLRINVPEGRYTTNAAYGGPGNKWLFFTESSTGTVYKVEMPVPGREIFSASV
jgi:gluconolactonase